MRSVNGLPGLSADAADLISVDFRSIRPRLLDFFTEEPFIGHLSRENVIGRKTVELTVRPTVKFGHGLFENSDNVVIRIRLLWKEILVLHGLVPGLGHAIRAVDLDLCDDSSDAHIVSFKEDGNLALILRSIIAHEIDFSVEEVKLLANLNEISCRVKGCRIKGSDPAENGSREIVFDEVDVDPCSIESSEYRRIHVQKSKGSRCSNSDSSRLLAESVSFFLECSRIREERILAHEGFSIGHHTVVDTCK